MKEFEPPTAASLDAIVSAQDLEKYEKKKNICYSGALAVGYAVAGPVMGGFLGYVSHIFDLPVGVAVSTIYTGVMFGLSGVYLTYAREKIQDFSGEKQRTYSPRKAMFGLGFSVSGGVCTVVASAAAIIQYNQPGVPLPELAVVGGASFLSTYVGIETMRQALRRAATSDASQAQP